MSPDVNDPGRSARKLVRNGAGEVGRPVGAPLGRDGRRPSRRCEGRSVTLCRRCRSLHVGKAAVTAFTGHTQFPRASARRQPR